MTLFLLLSAPFVGSFLGLLVHRLPRNESIAGPASRCDSCAEPLGLGDLIPFFGWLIRRGRCSQCGARIDPLYPVIEVAALAVVIWSLVVLPAQLVVVGSVLGWVLLTLAIIDARHFLLPDALTLPLIPAGLLAAWWVAPDHLGDHVIGAGVGFAAFFCIGWLYRRWRGHDGLGLGDAKLMAAAGAWVSWTGLTSVLLIASVSALLYAVVLSVRSGAYDRLRPIAFGTFLALALWITWMHGPVAIAWR